MLSFANAGPLALVEDGDIIAIDVLSQSIDLRVPHDEMKRRSESWTPPSLPLTQVRYRQPPVIPVPRVRVLEDCRIMDCDLF